MFHGEAPGPEAGARRVREREGTQAPAAAPAATQEQAAPQAAAAALEARAADLQATIHTPTSTTMT